MLLPLQCYIRFYEMMLVADLKPVEYGDNEASVCADLNQHEVRWIHRLIPLLLVHFA